MSRRPRGKATLAYRGKSVDMDSRAGRDLVREFVQDTLRRYDWPGDPPPKEERMDEKAEHDILIVRIVKTQASVDEKGEKHTTLDFMAEQREDLPFEYRAMLGRGVILTTPSKSLGFAGRLLGVAAKPTEDVVVLDGHKGERRIHRYTGKVDVDNGGEKLLGATVTVQKVQMDLPLKERERKARRG